MFYWVKRLAKRVIQRSQVSEEFKVIRQGSSSFVKQMRAINRGAPDSDETLCLDRVRSRSAELSERLGGVEVETSYRHVMQVMNAKEVFEKVSSPEHAIRMLFRLVRSQQPVWIVEIGSAFGIGSLAIACAASLKSDSRFDGFEFEEWRAEIAEEGVQRLMGDRAQVHAGDVEATFPVAAESNTLCDFAFVDAMHTYEATCGYHELLLPCMRSGGVVVYDDINWSEGMGKFWHTLERDTRLSDIVSVAGRWGIVRVG